MKESNLKLGIIIDNLSSSQASYYSIKNINDECQNSAKDDYVIFFEDMTANTLDPHFAIMNSSEVWSFDGILVSTSVSNSMLMLNSVNASKKFFYVWDLEWSRSFGRDYEYGSRAFKNSEIGLIARSNDHAIAIKNYCNRDVCGIVPDFNMAKVKEIIK